MDVCGKTATPTCARKAWLPAKTRETTVNEVRACASSRPYKRVQSDMALLAWIFIAGVILCVILAAMVGRLEPTERSRQRLAATFAMIAIVTLAALIGLLGMAVGLHISLGSAR